jgi:tetratricopeptide (TPR) repeat protein
MKHFFPAVFVVAILLVATKPAWAQDEIRYLDRTTKKEAIVTGSIQEETPAHIVFKSTGDAGSREVSASDVLDVSYDVPPAVRLIYGRAKTNERKSIDATGREADRRKALGDAVKDYQEMLPNLDGDRYRNAARHAHFKIARLVARQAEVNPEQIEPAIEALSQFKKNFADGWQISQAAKLLAHLQLLKGDAASAQRTYDELAAMPNTPKELHQECDLLSAEALIGARRFPEAQAKLEGLLKGLAADDPQVARIQIHLAECLGVSGKLSVAVARLQDIIAKSSDKDLIAMAYNALGDCYRLNGKPREAIWPYLFVDVVYHQDRDEHVKAMEQLAKLFDELGDKARARQYLDRLKRQN